MKEKKGQARRQKQATRKGAAKVQSLESKISKLDPDKFTHRILGQRLEVLKNQIKYT